MEIGRFDADLKMFVQPKKEADMNHLRFLRWCAENGFFDHYPLSVPRGQNFFRLSLGEINSYTRQKDQYRDLQAHLASTGDY